MKTLYIDCKMGAAGDMLASALLELVDDPDAAVEELNGLGIPGVVFRRETLSKCSLAATHLAVTVNGESEDAHGHGTDGGHRHHHGHHHHEHRSIKDIEHIVEGLSLAPEAREKAIGVYKAIAEAESRAHARPVGEVHFHEVGAMDAVADIAAFCHLIGKIAPARVVVSPVHVGSGSVVCAHGILPVPAPATAFLLEGAPTYSDGIITGELCTPTGAALVKTFADAFGPQPLITVSRIGYGAGQKDFERANVVMAVLGESPSREEGDTVCELAFNVDDMTGEELSFAAERIFSAGAKDVAIVPAFMKKGRPGHIVCVLCGEPEKEAVINAAFAHTSTIGIRERLCERHLLKRETHEIPLPDGSSIRRKDVSGRGVKRSKFEADDLAALALKNNTTLRDARAEAERLQHI